MQTNQQVMKKMITTLKVDTETRTKLSNDIQLEGRNETYDQAIIRLLKISNALREANK